MSFKHNSKRRRTSRSSRAGFSLMELMVVLLIIGLMSAAVSVGVRGYLAKARISTAKLTIQQLVNDLETFNVETARYPSQDEGLEILLEPIGEFKSGIIQRRDKLKDPWKNQYLYVVDDGERDPFEVICIGPDGREGTADDFSSVTIGNDE